MEVYLKCWAFINYLLNEEFKGFHNNYMQAYRQLISYERKS